MLAGQPMNDSLVAAALITLIGTCVTAVAGVVMALFYVLKRDPASARNGTIDRHTEATIELRNTLRQINGAATEAQRQNREEHRALIQAFERFTDQIAPRRIGGTR